MNKRILSVILTILTLCMLLSGCKKNVGTPEDNAVQNTEKTEEDEAETEVISGYTFGYSCMDIGDAYYDVLEQSIGLALKTSEYHLVSKNPGTDVELQIKQIQEMIDEGVDAVILCPVDWEKITPALNALREAEIPVINVDTQVKESEMADAYIGADNKNAGFLCGLDLVRQRPDGGKAVILEYPSINSVNERITGFEEATAQAAAGFEVLARVDVQGEKDTAKSEMKKLLEENAKIDAVMCGNDQIALGALEAIEESGRKNILVYGVDGSPEAKAELAKPDSAMTGTGTISPVTMGRKAVETGIAVLEEKEYEKELFIETYLIDKDNVKLYGTDGWQ